MTPREFLQANIDVIDKSLLKEAGKDLNELSTDAWYKKYSDAFINNKDTALDFLKIEQGKSLPERLRRAFGDYGFNPQDIHKQAIYQTQFKDVPREEFERVLSNMKKYYNEDIARQDSIKARRDREQEVKKWGFIRNTLASDYAKQRYIEEPETALIGEQAPALGKAPNTRWSAGADLGAGTVAAVADFIPPAWLVGPAIRTGRDIGYSVSNSKYAKDPRDWATERFADLGINLGARFLANARKGQRIANEMTNPEVARTLGVDATTEAINESMSKVNSLTMQSLNDKELINLINDLPESPMKADLINAIKTSEENLGRPINRKAIGDVVAKYQVETRPAIQESARGIREGNVIIIGDKGPFGKNASTYLKDVAQATPYKDLTKGQKASYLYNKLVGNFNKGGLGQAAVQEMANIQGRGHSTVNYDNSDEFKRLKEYYKQTRGEDWLKFGKAMAPKEQEGDPAWEAYKEVMGIK